MELSEAKKVLKEEIWRCTKFEDSRKRIAIEIVLKALEKYEKQLDLDYVDKNYISKDEVRKKIDEIEHKPHWAECGDDYENEIKLLQELLGE